MYGSGFSLTFPDNEKYITKDRKSNYLYIHPDDAKTRGIEHLDSVTVNAASGSITVTAKFDENMMPGAVALPHGWGHKNSTGQQVAQTTTGCNANVLVSDGVGAIEPLSGMIQFNGIDVEVTV